LLSFILLWIFGKSEDIICRNIIKKRELYQYIGRDISLTEFIIAVDLLRAVQIFRHLFLSYIIVFAKRTNIRIHGKISFENGKFSIYYNKLHEIY